MTHKDLARVLLPQWIDVCGMVISRENVQEKDLPAFVGKLRRKLVEIHVALGELQGTAKEESFPARRLTLDEVMEAATQARANMDGL